MGVVTTLGGEATVARATLAQPLALKMHDDVFVHDRITTRERSLVRVLLGNKALLTVRELSVLTITEGAGRATVDLQSGKVGLAVARQLMRPGEVIELRTPNVVVGVRGTVLVVEIVPDPSGRTPSNPAAVVTNVHLLHGKLDVSLRNAPAAAPVQLESRQTVQVSGNTLGPVRPLSPEAITAATVDLRVNELTRAGLPAEFLRTIVAQQQHLVSGKPGPVGRVLRSGSSDAAGSTGEPVNRVDNAAGVTSGVADGLGLGNGVGAAATNGIGSGTGVGNLLPTSLPTGLLTGK